MHSPNISLKPEIEIYITLLGQSIIGFLSVDFALQPEYANRASCSDNDAADVYFLFGW